MLSTFHVTTSVCVPDRCTAGLGASVNTSALVEQPATPASQVATVLNAAWLSVPAAPDAAVQAAAFHDTSEAGQVVSPAVGGVNAAAFAFSETRSCFEAEASTTWSIVTVVAAAAVAAPTFDTENEIPEGTATRACSLTVTDTVVVWLVSGRVTVDCAATTAA